MPMAAKMMMTTIIAIISTRVKALREEARMLIRSL
jgi:hypothetical protein